MGGLSRNQGDNPILGYFSRLFLHQAFGVKRRNLSNISGSFMFADLSGFTAMSDQLSVKGRSGAEELASMINSLFDPLLKIVFSHGGDVIKFGGDSVMVVFRGRKHTLRAYRCGSSLLGSLGQLFRVTTSAGEFPIAIHIGIADGRSISSIVGIRGKRQDHLICGPGPREAIEAAERAGPGEIYISRESLAKIDPGGDRGERRERFIKLKPETTTVNKKSYRPGPLDLNRYSLDSFLIPGLGEMIGKSAQGAIDGEHRHITAMFIGVDGWWSNLSSRKGAAAEIYRKVNHHISELFRITERYGGNIARLDNSHGGERALVLFGAPVLRENAPSDAAAAAFEILNITEKISGSAARPLRIKIGINSGVSYVGDVGGSIRREYTAMGKEINLAARLMDHAEWGEIIAGENTVNACGTSLKIIAGKEVGLKGIDKPVPILKVIGYKDDTAREIKRLDLIGRERELAAIAGYVSSLKDGSGDVLQLFGEAGAGKSVLIEQAYCDLSKSDIVTIKTACYQHSSNTPLAPIADILKQILGISDEDKKEIRKEKTRAGLAKISALEWEALIAGFSGYSARPTPEIVNLSESSRRARLFQIIYSLIARRLRERPGCLIIDDLHWADDTTIEFLKRYQGKLCRNKIGLIIAARFSENTLRFESGIILEPGMLDDSGSERLFKAAGGAELPLELTRKIIKVSGGNPFYLEEMGKAVGEIGTAIWTDETAIPESIERVITARIDRLDELVRTTIKTASVIGRVFGYKDLYHIFPVKGEKRKLPSYLRKSVELDITPLVNFEPAREYRFKHILTRDVAYEGLSYKVRRGLHGDLARYYQDERRSRGIGIELVGFHYERSDNPRRAVPFYLLAGISFARAFSNLEAIYYLKKIPELLGDDGNKRLLSRSYYELGKVFKLTGDYDEGERYLSLAAEICPAGLRWQKESLKELSELFRITGAFDKASDVLDELSRIDIGDPWSYMVYQNGMGEIARRRGNPEDAVGYLSEGLEKGIGVHGAVRAQVLNNLGICYWTLGNLDGAIKAYNEAKEIYEANRDLQGIAKIANNLGIIFELKGDFASAARLYGESAEIFRKIGNVRSEGYCYGNLATNFIARGLPGPAKDYIERAMGIFIDIDDRDSEALTAGNLADWYALTGDNEKALKECEKALLLAGETENEELICETRIRKARLNFDRKIDNSLLLESLRREAVERKWRDLELKTEFYMLEEEIQGSRFSYESLALYLDALDRKDPPPEIKCGIRKIRTVILFKESAFHLARRSLLEAYKISLKSDLVSAAREIILLYAALFELPPFKFQSKIDRLESRMLDGLEPAIRRIYVRMLDEKLTMLTEAVRKQPKSRAAVSFFK